MHIGWPSPLAPVEFPARHENAYRSAPCPRLRSIDLRCLSWQRGRSPLARSGWRFWLPALPINTPRSTVRSRKIPGSTQPGEARKSLPRYSGTDGNAVWVHINSVYDNAGCFSSDVYTAADHPGFPQDSDLLEHKTPNEGDVISVLGKSSGIT
jgi:hypothetical protein